MKKIILLIIFLSAVTAAFGHGMEKSIAPGRAVILKANYSGGEPMRYCEAKVYSPGEEKIEFLNGRTDKNGVLAFVPDQKGIWTVKVNDGMGHAFTETIDIKENMEAHGHSHGHLDTTKAVLAILVVFALIGAALYFKGKQNQKA